MMNPAGGPLTNGQLVSISTATPGASIRYTLDGSEPSPTTGLVYSAPLLLNPVRPIRVSAIAYEAGLVDSPVARTTYNPPLGMAVGQNLDEVVDWSASWPFVDVFKRTRTWSTRNADGSGPGDTGFESLIPVDTNGWPTQVPFAANGTPQLVLTIITALNEAGTYDFIYEGTGTLGVYVSPGQGGGYLTATGGVQSISFDATSTNSQVMVEIYSSASNDYLRNFHIVLTNFLATYETQPFHPLFLQRLQPFRCVRFVWWSEAPYSTLVSWTNRTTPSYYTQATYDTQTKPDGVALEYMVQLCNTLQENAWICIPAAADDDYVQRAAQLFYNSLSPNLRVYVEYANETWNGGYFGCTYARSQGLSLGLAPDAGTAGTFYVARRSGQIWNIFQQVFGSTASSRLVKVMATQTGNYGVDYGRIAGLLDPNINLTGVLPDALAEAPYFGGAVTGANTVDDILTNLAPQAIAEEQAALAGEKSIADAYGWWLVCYEGGQGFSPDNSSDTNEIAICEAANLDPRMGTLYTEYLDMLKAQGVSLFNHLSYCGNWGGYGEWGSLAYQDQPTNDAPKYEALVEWIAAHPVPAYPIMLTPAITTNGAASFVFTNNHDASFTVLTTTNLACPLAAWTVLGAPAETAPGTYQLTPAITTNESQRFFRVRSP
ncbi:MAG: chitobiase/beta-hexosaminidase C-terminal domain-containing protein [Verrucomicrobiota bacterium]